MKSLASLILVLATLPVLASPGHYPKNPQGGESGGGGYTSTSTSGAILRKDASRVARALSGISPERFHRVVSEFTTKTVDVVEFLEIIRNARIAPQLSMTAVNPDGFLEKKLAHYDVDSAGHKYIVMLDEYDRLVTNNLISDTERMRILIHEALHHYNIGVTPTTDGVARQISENLMMYAPSLLSKYYSPDCGFYGSIQDRINQCGNAYGAKAERFLMVATAGAYSIFLDEKTGGLVGWTESVSLFKVPVSDSTVAFPQPLSQFGNFRVAKTSDEAYSRASKISAFTPFWSYSTKKLVLDLGDFSVNCGIGFVKGFGNNSSCSSEGKVLLIQQ